MGDIKNPKILWLKGILFIVIGILSMSLLLITIPEWYVAVLSALAIWAFCRAYYFAFYVIEHYVDSEYRFSGLMDFFHYALKKKQRR